MTPVDPAALAARVEGLTGPDREADALIWAIADPEEHERVCSFHGYKYAGHVHSKDEKRDHIARMGQSYAPAYTASLDAAMTLVPEGLRFEVTTTGFKPGATVCGGGVMGVHEGAYAATPALALCAAALRARARSDDGSPA